MISVNDLRRGMAFKLNNELYIVTDQKHTKPGKGPAFVQLAYRSISSGRSMQNKFSPSDKVEQISLNPRQVQYLYNDGSMFHFMDLNDYHQFEVPANVIAEAKNYLVENAEIELLFHGETVLEVNLPAKMTLTVTESAPGVKGDTATKTLKPATLETGYNVMVPLFINEGEKIQVDTRTGKYISRA